MWQERNLHFMLEYHESARRHAKLRGLSPGGCGAALPPPPPAKPRVSASSETGERNEACCGSSSEGMTGGGSAAFARAVRSASRGVGNTRASGASERLQRAWDINKDGVGEVPGKEEGEGCNKRGPPWVQHRAHSS